MKYIHFDKIFHLCRKKLPKIRLNENDNIFPNDNNTVDELQVKLQFLEKENLSLKERKENIIQTIFNQIRKF